MWNLACGKSDFHTLSSPEPKVPGVLIGWDLSRRLCVRQHFQT